MSGIKTIKNEGTMKSVASTTWTIMKEVVELVVRSVPILIYYLVVAIIFILSFIPVLIAGIGIHNKRRN